MEIHWEIITAEATSGSNTTEAATVSYQPPSGTKFLVVAALQRVNQTGQNGQAEVGISEYVQNGTSNKGNWPLIEGENITSVGFYLRVASAQATASLVTFMYE